MFSVIYLALRSRGLSFEDSGADEFRAHLGDALPANVAQLCSEAEDKAPEERSMEHLAIAGMWLDIHFDYRSIGNISEAERGLVEDIPLGVEGGKLKVPVDWTESEILPRNIPPELKTISYADFQEVCLERGLQGTLTLLIHAPSAGEAVRRLQGAAVRSRISRKFQAQSLSAGNQLNPRFLSISNLAGGGSNSSSVSSENGTTTNQVLALSQAQVVLEQKVLEKPTYEAFKAWKISMQSFKAKGGVADPVLCIVPKASALLECLWNSDPELMGKCSWVMSSCTLGWDSWFKEVQDMLRKAEGKPRVSKADLNLKFGPDRSLLALEWLTAYREYVDNHDMEVDANKAVDTMLKHVDRACPGFAARQKECVADWKVQARAEGQTYNVSFALNKLTRPLLLHANVLAESMAYDKAHESESEEEGTGKVERGRQGERDKKRVFKNTKSKGDKEGPFTCFRCGEAGHKAEACNRPLRASSDKNKVDKDSHDNEGAKKRRFFT